MKAFLLAAGNGTRMRPLTDTTPKCLLPIQGTPLLGIWLELCRQHGIDEVLINTHCHQETIRTYVQSLRRGPAVRVTFEQTLLGSAGTLLENRAWVESESAFWIFYADVLTNANLKRILDFHYRRGQIATVGLYEVSNPRDCGIVAIDQTGIVREFVEKPSKPASNLAFTGIMVASPGIFDLISRPLPADIGFHLLPRLVGSMAGCVVSDYLMDVGTPDKYARAQVSWPSLDAGFSPENRAF
jgi:Nucleoside-diphosphate-sugar pyrophosphorylase involved in lipopolysaccharide biosynthesis/translation initiation factor 2B, gamma/epsilon subunits (eIF-2Bgamma/eIF-2Bepsilon)